MSISWNLLGRLVAWVWKMVPKPSASSIEITDPPSRGEVLKEQPIVNIKGKSKNALTKKYWLLTRKGNDCYPQQRITLQHDGLWKSHVHIGTAKGIHYHTVVLAQTNSFGDVFFQYYKDHGPQTKWEPIKLPKNEHAFIKIQEIEIAVEGTDQGGTINL
jgi:hypothetical protein